MHGTTQKLKLLYSQLLFEDSSIACNSVPQAVMEMLDDDLQKHFSSQEESEIDVG